MAAMAPAAPTSPAAALGRVEVTSAGFQPSRIDVGSDRSLVFRRTTDKTCATSVVFPGLGIEKTLPLNTDVAIELPPGTRGELAFQCGMGMDRGKVIVR
jgi:plastocyanin domain-containing protein